MLLVAVSVQFLMSLFVVILIFLSTFHQLIDLLILIDLFGMNLIPSNVIFISVKHLLTPRFNYNIKFFEFFRPCIFFLIHLLLDIIILDHLIGFSNYPVFVLLVLVTKLRSVLSSVFLHLGPNLTNCDILLLIFLIFIILSIASNHIIFVIVDEVIFIFFVIVRIDLIDLHNGSLNRESDLITAHSKLLHIVFLVILNAARHQRV
jgi:hypothetical protein